MYALVIDTALSYTSTRSTVLHFYMRTLHYNVHCGDSNGDSTTMPTKPLQVPQEV